jgi:hypothetical protein
MHMKTTIEAIPSKSIMAVVKRWLVKRSAREVNTAWAAIVVMP